MTASATMTGLITYPDSDIGIDAEVMFVPQVQGYRLVLSDRTTVGPSKGQTDPAGNIQTPGINVPIVAGVLWTMLVTPYDNNLAPFQLGPFPVTASSDVKDLGPTIPTMITAAVYADIQAAIALGATNDTATASFVGSSSSATDAALKGREVGVNIIGAGMSGNGTDETTAFNALLTAATARGLPVIIPQGKTVGVSSIVSLPANAHIRGRGTIKALASAFSVIDVAAANVTLEDVTILTNNFATSAIRPQTGADSLTLRRVKFTSTAGTPNGVNVDAQVIDRLVVDDCDFSGFLNSIRSNISTVTRSEIKHNRIRNWLTRGIYFLSDATNAADDLLIFNNRVTDLVSGQQVRYPIRIEGSTTSSKKHTGVRVDSNYVKGPGVPYSGTNTSPWVGTADQISITMCDVVKVTNNTSIGGGDGGITVTNNTDAVVNSNHVYDTGNGGIYYGANGLTTPGSHIATINGNIVLGAGRDTSVDVSDCAIRVYDASDVTITGNTLGNWPGSTVTTHGISYKNGDNVTIGSNTYVGITGPNQLYDGGGNTNITLPSTSSGNVSCVQTAGDQTLPQSNSTTYNDIAGLSATLAAGTYLISGYVEYEASLTADLRLKFDATGLTGTGTWTAAGLRSAAATAGSVSDSINRAANPFTGNVIIGGTNVGTNLSASIAGRIVVTASGVIKLTATQGTADASDVKIRNSALTYTKVA